MVYAETTDFSAHAVAYRAEARALTAQPHRAAVDGIGLRHAHRAEARALTSEPHSANIRNARRDWTDFDGKTRFVPLHRHVIISPALATHGAGVLLTSCDATSWRWRRW